MKIYTKGGDKGQTSLLGGTRISKAHLRIDTYGTIDELNSYLGWLRDLEVNNDRKDLLKEIQDRLFTIGSHLAMDPEKTVAKIPDLHDSDVTFLENEIDQMTASLAEMKSFILPGGHSSVSLCHVARCVCRRAERLVIALHQESPVEATILSYVNRLSDFLFVLARKMGQELGIEELPWKPRR